MQLKKNSIVRPYQVYIINVDTRSIDCLIYNAIRSINEQLPSNRSLLTAEAHSYLKPTAIKDRTLVRSHSYTKIKQTIRGNRVTRKLYVNFVTCINRIDSVLSVWGVRSFSQNSFVSDRILSSSKQIWIFVHILKIYHIAKDNDANILKKNPPN